MHWAPVSSVHLHCCYWRFYCSCDLSAPHLRLDHPTPHQLYLAMKRHFYGLDMTKSIERVANTCYTCASLHHRSNNIPPAIHRKWLASVMLQMFLEEESRSFFIPRETTTSFASATIIPDEKSPRLRDSLFTLVAALRSPTDHLPRAGLIPLRASSLYRTIQLSNNQVSY